MGYAALLRKFVSNNVLLERVSLSENERSLLSVFISTVKIVRADLRPRSVFISTKAHKEQRTGKILGAFFTDVQGFGRLDTGSRTSFNGSMPPSPPLVEEKN